MRIPRLLTSLLLLSATLPVVRADITPPAGPLPLTDDEAKIRLTKEESAEWTRLAKLRELADRDLKRGQELQKPNRATLRGPAEESPEARFSRGQALATEASLKLTDIATKTDVIRNAVAARMTAEARKAPCPSVAMADIFKKGASDIAEAAKAAGYEHLAVTGVFTTNGETVTSDGGFTTAFLAAFTPEGAPPLMHVVAAPAYSGGKLTVASPKTAIVIAEMHPMRGLAGLDGILWSARITDPDTGLVKNVSLAYIPAPNSYNAAENFEAVLLDRRNFLAKLGPAADWPFGIDGFGITQTLLRATLVAGPKPPLDDFAFFIAATRSPKTSDKTTKALWSIESKEGRHFVLSRRAGDAPSAAIRMGELVFAPAAPKPTGQ